MSKTITVNRAPVLTLWAAVVTERLGYNWNEALTLGKAVAGLTAQSKGQHLGIYAKPNDAEKAARKQRMGAHQFIELCERNVPARRTKDGIRAMKSFGNDLEKDDLQAKAFGLYEEFRPAVSSGIQGWGQKGGLDIGKIEGLQP